MCELYGIVSNKDILINDTAELFYSNSEKHCHGWGLYCTTKNKAFLMHKDKKAAHESTLYKNLFSKQIKCSTAIGHIRYATVGSIKSSNSHPFIKEDISGRQWVLAHNGNIFEHKELLAILEKNKNITDSEGILIYLIDKINSEINKKGSDLTPEERCIVVEKVITSLSKKNRVGLLIYDNDLYYVHSNYKDCMYYSMGSTDCCFTSIPLKNNYIWEKVPLNTLFVYRGNSLFYTGKNHGYEYTKPPTYRP